MREPATYLVTRELTEIAIQYLCQREVEDLSDAIDAGFARQRPTTVEELSVAISTSRKILELGLRPPAPARKRGRPQHHERHLQIAGAVAMLVEDEGLAPTRSHCGRRRQSPSACSIVAAALAQVDLSDYLGGERRGEHLSERTVEDIWNQYRLSPLIFHQGATDFARGHRYRKSSGIIR